MIYDNGVLSCEAGRIKVEYNHEQAEIKVVRLEDEQVLLTEQPDFNLTQFIRDVEFYRTVCNPNKVSGHIANYSLAVGDMT